MTLRVDGGRLVLAVHVCAFQHALAPSAHVSPMPGEPEPRSLRCPFGRELVLVEAVRIAIEIAGGIAGNAVDRVRG